MVCVGCDEPEEDRPWWFLGGVDLTTFVDCKMTELA